MWYPVHLLLLLLGPGLALQTSLLDTRSPGIDIFSTLHQFRKNLLDLLSKGLNSQRPPMAPSSHASRPPASRPPQHHPVGLSPGPPAPQNLNRPHVLPSLPPHHMAEAVFTVQQHLAQAFPHIETNSPFTSSFISSFSSSQAPPPLNTFEVPIKDINLPSMGHAVIRPNKAGALALGPHSFVDSTRVHAGEGIDTGAGDPDVASHIRPNLWREDIKAIHGQGFKEHKDFLARSGRPSRLVRRVRRPRAEEVIPTPSVPYLTIE